MSDRTHLKPLRHLAWLCLALILAGCATTTSQAPVEAARPGSVSAPPPPASSPSSGATPSPGSASPAPVAELPAPVRPLRLPRIGLALGGGAARGFAHIGVIQVLEEQGVKVDLVAGTSAGSLVAALYASGKNGKELASMAEAMDEGAITDWAFPTRGLIRGEALARFVRDKTGNRLIEQMSLPLGIVATDLSDGSPILFRSGDTGAAVRASSAVPAVFQPVKIGSREYVDGGLVAPVPVRYAKQMGAELIIAVDISEPPESKPPGDAMRMLLQTFSIMGRSINNFELREADVVIRPKLDGVGSADFSARRRSIQAGRDAAQAMLTQLRQRLAAKSR
ncbi:patatin-like phospholipase family protein [Paucibacter sp. APW11]|uniref:Patatin-like phospholipase family protein n=1 Tax=Roseateles aquae TaxID=3077235 RepID=A0ABU3P7Y6_9BURK|nr:patatin-like phospholipase family protein [Paucibacter sp. APW11]MDT8998675.1 patatin-like phospholipase family protein [Paucibacter sp. APW11]